MHTLRLTTLLLCPVLMTGCFPFDLGSARDGTPPSLTNAARDPATIQYRGGNVTLQADVIDAGGVGTVWAEIAKPDGTTENVPLANASGTTYAAVWPVSGNSRTDGQTLTYGIRIQATDASGNAASSDVLTLTVEPAQAPPAGPPGF